MRGCKHYIALRLEAIAIRNKGNKSKQRNTYIYIVYSINSTIDFKEVHVDAWHPVRARLRIPMARPAKLNAKAPADVFVNTIP